VVAVELHPELSRLGRQSLQTPELQDVVVDWVISDARSYVARTPERFDLISIAPSGGLGGSTAGIVSLNEDFLHTVDAYSSYLRCLSHNGMLAVTRWLTVPPRESIRVLLTMTEALRRVAPENVSDGFAVVRSWGTVTVIAKPSGFNESELETLHNSATRRQFDVDWRPGLIEPSTVFNHMDEPTLFRAAAAIEHADSLKRFLTSYPFSVAAVTDARPYPHHFLRFESLTLLFGEDRGSWLPFAEWGLIALLATLAQSAILAALLLAVPIMLAARTGSEPRGSAHIAYFLAIGFAYMAAEIAAIQQLSLLLGHPVYAVAGVLATFLICSGFGSRWSDRLSIQKTWLVSAGLVVMLILFGVALIRFVHMLQPAPLPLRAIASAVIVCPLAFLMGIPFPHGLRLLAASSRRGLAWAWAANGFASVVAAPLSALIALERGSPELFVLAAVAYGVAAIVCRRGTENLTPQTL
jgi:hypothetical protein